MTFIISNFADSKFKSDACKPVTPPACENAQPSSGHVLAAVDKNSTNEALTLPPPLPPKKSISLLATNSVSPLPPQRTNSLSRKDKIMKVNVPEKPPPELPMKRSAKSVSLPDKTNDKYNVYEMTSRMSACAKVEGFGKTTEELSLPSQSIPSWKAVVNLPVQSKPMKVNSNNKYGSLPVLPKKKVLVSPSSFVDCSDTVPEYNQKFVSEPSVTADKYVSIHNDNSSDRINIFVSKPVCIMESSDSSEDEDECPLSNRVQRLPPLHQQPQVFPPPPLSAPLSGPPPFETKTPLSSLSAAKSASVHEILLSSDGTYSLLRMPPKQTTQQVSIVHV